MTNLVIILGVELGVNLWARDISHKQDGAAQLFEILRKGQNFCSWLIVRIEGNKWLAEGFSAAIRRGIASEIKQDQNISTDNA